jgi:hypothetical protein
MMFLIRLVIAMVMALQVAVAASACQIAPGQTEQTLSALGDCHEAPSGGNASSDPDTCTVACTAFCAITAMTLTVSDAFGAFPAAVADAGLTPVLHGRASALDPPVPRLWSESQQA